MSPTRDAVSRAEILGLLGQLGKLSRSEIAKKLNLGPATVTAQVRRPMSDGYVRELPADARAGAGRPRIPVELVAESAVVIGMGVTPTSVTIVSMLIDGTITDARTTSFDPSSNPLGQFKAMVIEQQSSMEHPERVVAIGISVSGAVDQALSTVRISATLNWRDFNLGAQLERSLNKPVFVSNDLFALSTREVSFGLGRNKDDFLLLGLGFGVGLGIVNHRKVFYGSTGSSTEFGHMSIDPGRTPVRVRKLRLSAGLRRTERSYKDSTGDRRTQITVRPADGVASRRSGRPGLPGRDWPPRGPRRGRRRQPAWYRHDHRERSNHVALGIPGRRIPPRPG